MSHTSPAPSPGLLPLNEDVSLHTWDNPPDIVWVLFCTLLLSLPFLNNTRIDWMRKVHVWVFNAWDNSLCRENRKQGLRTILEDVYRCWKFECTTYFVIPQISCWDELSKLQTKYPSWARCWCWADGALHGTVVELPGTGPQAALTPGGCWLRVCFCLNLTHLEWKSVTFNKYLCNSLHHWVQISSVTPSTQEELLNLKKNLLK